MVVWEDSEVELLETRRDGRGIYTNDGSGFSGCVLKPQETPVFSDPWQLLHYAEEACELRGTILSHTGWGPVLPAAESFDFVN